MSLDNLLGIIGMVASSIAFVVGLFQYREGQRWKALEFVSNEIKEFFSNRDVINVLKMLEVNRRPINFYDDSKENEKVYRLVVSDELIISAFKTPDMRDGVPITNDEGLVRDTFRTFFDYLARFSNFIHSLGLIRYADIHPYLNNWLAILCDEKYGRKHHEFVTAVTNYLEFYRYKSVLSLFQHYRKWTKRHPQSFSK